MHAEHERDSPASRATRPAAPGRCGRAACGVAQRKSHELAGLQRQRRRADRRRRRPPGCGRRRGISPRAGAAGRPCGRARARWPWRPGASAAATLRRSSGLGVGARPGSGRRFSTWAMTKPGCRRAPRRSAAMRIARVAVIGVDAPSGIESAAAALAPDRSRPCDPSPSSRLAPRSRGGEGYGRSHQAHLAGRAVGSRRQSIFVSVIQQLECSFGKEGARWPTELRRKLHRWCSREHRAPRASDPRAHPRPRLRGGDPQGLRAPPRSRSWSRPRASPRAASSTTSRTRPTSPAS